MIELTDEQRRIVCSILAHHLPPQVSVRAFGSRAKAGQAKTYSDLDLLLVAQASLPLEKLFNLQEMFEDSELPFRVEVIDAARTSDSFLRKIQNSCIEIYHS